MKCSMVRLMLHRIDSPNLPTDGSSSSPPFWSPISSFSRPRCSARSSIVCWAGFGPDLSGSASLMFGSFFQPRCHQFLINHRFLKAELSLFFLVSHAALRFTANSKKTPTPASRLFISLARGLRLNFPVRNGKVASPGTYLSLSRSFPPFLLQPSVQCDAQTCNGSQSSCCPFSPLCHGCTRSR